MPINQFTVLFGSGPYQLHIPVNTTTQYKFIDGHEVLTLAVANKPDTAENATKIAQKEFAWMAAEEIHCG